MSGMIKFHTTSLHCDERKSKAWVICDGPPANWLVLYKAIALRALVLAALCLATPIVPASAQDQAASPLPQTSAETNSAETIMPVLLASEEDKVQGQALPDLTTDAELAQPFRVGLVAERGAAYLQARIEPFRKYLQQSLDRPVEVVAFSNLRALIAAHVSRKVDYAVYPASAFALAQASCGCLLPLVAPIPIDARDGTYMMLIVKASSGITSLAGLTGRSLALSSASAAIPYHMGLNELRHSGLNPEEDFQSIRVEKDPQSALMRLEAGEVDAALVWASSPYNQSLFETRGAVLAYWQAKKANANNQNMPQPDFLSIWHSRPVPPGPHAVHNETPKQLRADLITLLKAMNKDAPEAYDAIERHHAGGFRSVLLEDYAPLIEIATAK